MRYKMPFGNGNIIINISERANCVEIQPKSIIPLKDPVESFINTLNHPIKANSLRGMIQKKVTKEDKIVVVIDDQTRNFPFKIILPPFIEYVRDCGVQDSQVCFLIACGAHKPPSKEHLNTMFGNLLKGFMLKISSSETADYISLGTTSRNTPVLINQTYVGAAFRILLTDITLHYFAGFGGDRKSILPGVAARSTIESNHKLLFKKGVGPGILDGNPVHEDMLEGAKFIGADFVCNICLNDQNKIFHIASGRLNEAFRTAVNKYKEIFSVRVTKQADLLLISQGGYPYDINYYQSQKALQQCIKAVKPGGTIIYFTQSSEGIGNEVLEKNLRIFNTSDDILKVLEQEFRQ
ncbi:MAG: nickel-dependent lactate racemase, partial [Candidatus Lokiarchaeota archaeon]|nr:nickel-dependent lactate racemase [Candidatus Lokiarchaeota archaeon]